jgi:fructokinase
MKIVSIGEILFDCFQDQKVIGGAPFNFFYHIYKLTNSAEFISSVGNDENGKSIISFLKKNRISTNYIRIDEKHPTGFVNIKVGKDGSPTFTVIPNCAYDFIELMPAIKELIESDTTLLYFGTLAQRNDVSRKTIQSLLNKNIKYFYDINLRANYYSSEILAESLKKVNVLKLNIDELKIVSELFLSRSFELQSSPVELRRKFDIDLLSVTLGEGGALLIDKFGMDENKYLAKKVVDTVGAGDAYSAILCLGYLNKLPIDRINSLANKFASYICSIRGAIPPDDEFYESFKEELKT